MATITVSDNFKKLAEKVQEKRGLGSIGEAVDAIGVTYAGRMNAINKYAKEHPRKAAPKAKKKASKKTAKAA